ncbi:MAG: starvation/stationary phase protection protein [Bacteroidetes bacterium]|jgi:starvation-inducible DNA-binding protein|nr:starvation/stationary phase protection protein [Bacteroidota bacterium]
MKAKGKDKTDLVAKLNSLLAAYQVAFFNVRSSHWLIKGENFFELHKVFENAYNDANQKIDEIAERILTLGGKPFLTVTEMLNASSIKESAGCKGDQAKCVAALLDDFRSLETIESEIVRIADDQDDVVTADMMTKYLGEQQKTGWMLSQFMEKRSSIVK